MKNNDLMNREQIRGAMQTAIKEDNTEAFSAAFDQMLDCIQHDIQAEYQQYVDEAVQGQDSAILAARGVRQLTSEEKTYYQKLGEAMKARNPKQAISDLDVALPETVVNAVFDELQTEHPLLSRINFMPSRGSVKMLINANGYELASWGALCDEIVKELTAGLEEIDTGLYKLSAFLPVCKAMLELGAEWLDNFVRQTLYEALANGMEAGIISGDGDEQPIGMNRQVGEGVAVVGGVYPEKETIAVNNLSPATVGNLLSLLAVDASGKPRKVSDVIFVVNEQDYLQKVMPATTLMAPDGSYRNDVMPYPMTIIRTAALDRGKAIIGIANKYFAAAGIAKEGRIEYSDEYRFLEDERVYLIKTYANGMPMDNNAFLYLDISNIQPAVWKVEQIVPVEPSDDATLSALTIGALTLTPAFDPDEDTYEAATTNATNTITATPADAGAAIKVEVNDVEIPNGSAATWEAGENEVVITVTAADGTTTGTYTVTVTKS